MSGNNELELALKTMAADFRLPGGGRMKLSRLVAKHLGWFDAAGERGMGWRDMIRALAAAGVVGPTGKQLSVGTLSSTVWRVRAKADKKESKHDPQRRFQNLASSKGSCCAVGITEEAENILDDRSILGVDLTDPS